jgi:glucuronide carrier protein
MPVITISRHYGSGGRDVARLLCERLGYQYFVRLVAPVERRVRRVQWREGLDIDDARARVSERDEASLDYVRRYYDADVDDPLLYDMVLNMHTHTPAVAADLIVASLTHVQAR